MKDTLSGIVDMLETGGPEQRVAAAQVLAWLKPKMAPVVKALGQVAQEGDSFLRPYAVEALGAIGNAASMAALVPFLHVDGPVRNKVIRIYSRAGKAAATALIKEYAKTDPVTQATILEILSKIRSDEALEVLFSVLKDPEQTTVADRVYKMLRFEIEQLDHGGEGVDGKADLEEAERLRKKLQAFQKAMPKKTPASSRAHVLSLMSMLAEPSMRTLFVVQSAPNQSPEVRAAALKGLIGMELTPAQTTKLMGYLREDDFLHIIGPSLEVLEDLEPSGAQMANAFAKLLEGDRPEVRLFAIRKLGCFETATSAKLLLPFLDIEDLQHRSEASRSIGRNPAAAEGVLKRFLAGRDLEEAGRPLEALQYLAPHLDAKQLRKLVQGYLSLLEREDPVRDLYRQVLAHAESDLVGPVLLKEAQKLRGNGSHDQALHVLRILAEARDGKVEGEARYELALVTMLQRPILPEGSEGDPVIGHLCHLLSTGYKLLDKIKKEKALDPEQVYYLGQRFVERLNEERRFGQDLLNWLIEREPEGKASVQAMQKLKVEGLA